MRLNASAKGLLFLASAPVSVAPSSPGAPVDILSYTGGLMYVAPHGWCVVDLAGCQVGGSHPLLADHQNTVGEVVGQGATTVRNGQLFTAGKLTDVTDAGKRIIGLHKTGFTFQASIGLQIIASEAAPPGAAISVNGQQIVSPSPSGCLVVTQSKLREVSITPLGCDPGTTVTIQARQTLRGSVMSFEDFVKSLGLDPATISPEMRAALEIAYAAQNPPAPAPAAPAATATASWAPARVVSVQGPLGSQRPITLHAADGGATAPTFEVWLQSQGLDIGSLTDQQKAALQMTFSTLFPGATVAAPPPDPAASARSQLDFTARQAQESQRVHDLRTMCAAHGSPTLSIPGPNGQAVSVSLEAHAISNGWTTMRLENHLLRASMPQPPMAIIRGGPNHTPQVLEAALAMSGRLRNVERHFDPQTLDAAHRQFPRGIGVQEILMLAARQNGWGGNSFRSDIKGVLQAAFSTLSLPGILSNNVNKFLLQGYTSVEDVWRRITAIRPVNDFKTITSYRMVGAFTFQKVAPTGELKHGTMSEESYTNRAETYGIMAGLTRVDLINDDLGAFSSLPQEIGAGAGRKLNDVFWTEFMDNSTFFTSGRSNYFTGAATNLQASSLQTAEQKFLDQKDPNNKPLAIEPRILLVPTAVSGDARSLMQSQGFNTGGSSTTEKVPSSNIWYNRFQPEVSAYLSNSAFTGYSSTAWYLLADPAVMPVIEVAFLNGVDTPTVESADADFNTLGIQFRGYFDFGVSKQQYRGGVKSKGAA